jgi:tetratricopeptide (TPR) repeat protein
MVCLLALVVIWTWFAVRWHLGNTLAEYITEQNGLALGQFAVSLGPDDPLTHWSLGELARQNLPADQMDQVVREFAKAASLSPNDYRFWMALGLALEQSGELARGELALRRAVDLAPSYSYPRWYLGNLLLRASRFTEAFAELSKASEANPRLQSQVFNLAWGAFNNDFESLKAAVGTSLETRAQFSAYLLERGRFEDGLKLWNSLSEAEQKDNRKTGESVIKSLIEAKRYHQAADVWNRLVPTSDSRVTVGKFADGGFEGNVVQAAGAAFGWRFRTVPQIHVGIDPALGHSGSRSLRISFQVRSRVESMDISQLVTVYPRTQYVLESFVKANNLQSAGTPVIELIDASDGSLIATSPPAPSGNSDWQPVVLSFTTGAKTDAVKVRINRASCGENSVCPIFGTVWYDDFNLKSRD